MKRLWVFYCSKRFDQLYRGYRRCWHSHDKYNYNVFNRIANTEYFSYTANKLPSPTAPIQKLPNDMITSLPNDTVPCDVNDGPLGWEICEHYPYVQPTPAQVPPPKCFTDVLASQPPHIGQYYSHVEFYPQACVNTAKASLTSWRIAAHYTSLQTEELTEGLNPLDSYSQTVTSTDSATHGDKQQDTNQTPFALKFAQPSLPWNLSNCTMNTGLTSRTRQIIPSRPLYYSTRIAKAWLESSRRWWNHRKKKLFFKVFKLPGIKCITTVSKENVQKKSDDQDGGTSFTKFSTIRWWNQAYEWSKWTVDDAVETHSSGILFRWKSKSYSNTM